MTQVHSDLGHAVFRDLLFVEHSRKWSLSSFSGMLDKGRAEDGNG